MPDIKTALSSVINQWEKSSAPVVAEPPKTAFRFQPTTNVSRATFEAVRDNPGKTRIELVDLLGKQGFPATSTTSILSRMLRQGTAQMDDERGVHVTTPEYVPLKSGTALKKLATINKRGRPRKVQEYSPAPAPAPVPTPLQNVTLVPVPPVPPAKFELTADYIVKHVSLAEAKRLYEELGQYFK